MSILVVDDEEDMLLIVREVLESVGYDVATASNGEDAISLKPKKPFELVLCDMWMPRLDGMALRKYLDETAPGVPFVLMTGNHQLALDEREKGRSVLLKPFNLEEMVEFVRSQLTPKLQAAK